MKLKENEYEIEEQAQKKKRTKLQRKDWKLKELSNLGKKQYEVQWT
jgi:hypothetical protein